MMIKGKTNILLHSVLWILQVSTDSTLEGTPPETTKEKNAVKTLHTKTHLKALSNCTKFLLQLQCSVIVQSAARLQANCFVAC